jgi:MoxR-like ATPase
VTPRESIVILEEGLNRLVIGQPHLIERFIIGLLADGNLLLEGLPGLAKTRAVRSLAELVDARFSRIQFTPDLTPKDVLGEERIYEEHGNTVARIVKGPIFGNIVLADEINRAPARVQAAMLEAMEEKQVTIAGRTIPLPRLFMVLATQNPIEQVGTYPLAEAQKDRFLMHVEVGYVDRRSELEMVRMIHDEKRHVRPDLPKIPQEAIFAAREEAAAVTLDEPTGRYLVELVFATRYPLQYSKQLEVMIEVGVSPRGTLALSQCSRVHAWLNGRTTVSVADIHAVIHDVFRHRLIASEHTRRNDISNDEIVDIILQQVPQPE